MTTWATAFTAKPNTTGRGYAGVAMSVEQVRHIDRLRVVMDRDAAALRDALESAAGVLADAIAALGVRDAG